MATEEQHPVSNSISPPSASLSLSPAANAAQDQEAEDLAPLQTHPDLLDDHGQDQGAATPPKATPSPSKRGRGRPRGSCNKKKSEMTYPGAKKASPVKKRGRGRPPKKGREEIVRPQLLTPSSGFPQTLPPPSSTEVLQSPVNFLAHPAFYESDPLEEDLSGPGPDESSSHEDPSQDSSSAAENNGPPGAPETLLQDNVAPNNNEPGPMPHQPVLPKRPSLSRVQQSNSSSSAESSRTNSPSQARPVRGGGRGRGRPRGRPRGSGRASTIQRQENNTSSGKLEDVMEEAITPEKAVNGVSPSSTGKLGRGRPLAGNYTTPTATPPMKVKSRWRRSSEMEQNHSEEDEKPAPIPNNNSGGINEQLLSHPAMDWNRKARIQLKQLSPNTLSSNILAPSTTPITTLASATSSSNSLLTTTLSTPPSSSLRPRTNRRRLSRSPSSSPESRSRSISPRRRKGSQKIEDSAGEEDEDWKKNDHINSLPETKAEIKARLESFQHIRENNFLCERKFNKQSRGGGGMECDCTISREEINSGKKGCGDDCLNRLLMIECSKYCSLGKYCGNKKFQNVENAPVEIFKTTWKGFGLRAVKAISADEFVMEYVGDVLDDTGFRRRAKKYAKADVQHFYFMALTSEFFIDASTKGNISRFINHSCDPNSETQKWTVNGELRVGFFTKRNIRAGEELTFDYKYERYGQEAQKCYCGSSNCRGWLGGEPDKENEIPEEEEEEGEDDYWSTDSEAEESSSNVQAAKPSSASQPSTPTSSRRVSADVKAAATEIGSLSVSSSPAATASSSSAAVAATAPAAVATKEQLHFTPTTAAARVEKVKKKRKKRKSPRKIKNYEDDEHDEELERLRTTGIRTKTHTVELCRLMVRTTDLHTRLSLAGLVSDADLPCKRLFLDYHGLKILQNWMSGLGWTPQDLDLKLAMEDVLRSLNVPNRTMLNESKVWETISRWSKANPENEAELLLSRASSPDHNPSKESTSSPPRTPLSVTPATSVEGTPVPAEKAKAAARTILETIDVTKPPPNMAVSTPPGPPPPAAAGAASQNLMFQNILRGFTVAPPLPPPPPPPQSNPSIPADPFSGGFEPPPPGEEGEPLPPGEESEPLPPGMEDFPPVSSPGWGAQAAEENASKVDLKEEDIKSSPVQEKSEANCDSVSDSGCPDSTKCDTKMEEGNEAVTPKNEDIERVTESPMEVDDNPAPIISESDEEIKAIAEEKVKELVEIIASQKVDDSTGTHNTKEKDEEKVSPDVKPVAKPETEASKDSDQKLQKEIDALVKKIQDQAIALLEDWKRLKESFKIPKRELVKMRAEHEREVDRAAARFQEQPHHHRDMAPSSSRAGFLHPEHHHPPKHHHSSHHLQHQQQPHHHHHHHHQQHVQAHHHKPFQSSYERNRPARPESPTNTKRERRISRFDDQTGFLQKTDLSREHRRQLFSLKAETEEKEKRKRLLQQQQHENKCYYLRLDPALTPMFAQYPEFYFDDMAGQWIPMPEPYPEIEVNWGYAGMAHLPLEAFQIIDPPLPDPAYVYPPGVVPVSYLFGPPPDEQQQNHQEPELLPPLPPDQADSADSTSRPPPPEYVPFLSSEPNSNNSIPFLGGEARAGPYNMQPDYDLASQEQHPDPVQNPSALDNGGFFPGMDMAAGANGSSSSIGGRQGNSSRLTERPNVVIKLPPRWKTCKDAEGRLYFYNTKTKEAQWDPPPDSVQDDDHDPTKELLDEDDVTMVEIENNDETNGEGGNDEDGDTDDEDDDEEEVDKRNAEEIDLMSSDSDLSAHEKELLLAKKKTKEERQHERRQKRERDREKREYERKRRRERHGRHRKEGLVIEHFIPRRTAKEKTDLMSLREIRERLANKDQIRERQDLEERAEAERDRAKRAEAERQAIQKQRAAAAAAHAAQVAAAAPSAVATQVTAPRSLTTTAAADTSSEVAKKCKERFLKEASKVIVKVLDPYRRPDAKRGQIRNTEDFKHLAKKLTQYILTKELKHCPRIEDLRCTDSVKKKTAEFVRKYMSKYGEEYKRSPSQQN